MMIYKVILPVLAVMGLGFGIVAARQSASTLAPAPMASAAPIPPYETYVAGAGIVEANTENIAIGTPIAGIVSTIHGQIGQRVRKDDPLFCIDDRAVRAILASQQAAVKVAEAQLAQAKYQWQLGDALVNKRVISREDADLRRYVVETTAAQLHQARAQADASQTELDRLTIRAPVDGTVLQLKIHLGEYAQTGAYSPPLVLLGDIEPLHLRVDVDENEAWRVRHGAPAVGFIRGNPHIRTRLLFVRFEPFVIPKTSLTGATTERVDTRVLQVIYSFYLEELPIKPGQQMDVYIQAPPHPASADTTQPRGR